MTNDDDRCPCGELEDDCDCNWKQPASTKLQEALREALGGEWLREKNKVDPDLDCEASALAAEGQS